MRSTRPTVLYEARPTIWMSLLQTGCLGALMLACLGASVGLLLKADLPVLSRLLGAGILLAPILLGAMMLVVMVRMRFTVTTDGIEVVNPFRPMPQRIPWHQIARVEYDRGRLRPGRTIIVLRDGRRVAAAITGAYLALRRGEDMMDHGPHLQSPATPTLAARRAHVRWLRGEFAAPPP